MARYPGTETHTNRGGFAPGDGVRCLRSRANAELKLADRRGVVTEVRPGNVRVLFDARGGATWLANEALAREPDLQNPDLQLIGSVLRALRAQRLELDADEDELVVFSAEYPVAALDEVRALFGPRLLRCAIRAAGVHELATHLSWRVADAAGTAGAADGAGSARAALAERAAAAEESAPGSASGGIAPRAARHPPAAGPSRKRGL